MSADSAGLTGLELYSLEKAGYCLRREELNTESIQAILESPDQVDMFTSMDSVRAILNDLFPTGWTTGEAHSSQAESPELTTLELGLAITAGKRFRAAPGSHLDPSILQTTPEKTAYVKPHLNAGDLVVMDTRVIHEWIGDQSTTLVISFARASHG